MSTSRSPDVEVSLLNDLSRLSRWPDEPFRAWIMPGCRFSMLESWQYEDASNGFFNYSTLEASTAIKQICAKPKAHNGQSPIAGVKILVVEGGMDPLDPMVETYDLSKERSIMEAALKAFGLCPATGDLFSLGSNAPTNHELLQMHGGAKDRLTTKFLLFPYQSIAWTSNLQGSMTYAIFRSDPLNLDFGTQLAHRIQEYAGMIDLPLLLPYQVCHLATDYNGSMLLQDVTEIRIIELQSGFNTWSDNEGLLQYPTVDAELTALSKKASGVAAATCSRETDASQVQIAVQSLIKEHRLEIPRSDSTVSSQDLHWRELDEGLRVLDGILSSQTFFAKEIHRRAVIQQQAIFQDIAQRDQRLSLEVAQNSHTIAWQSTKDTLSMETIACMTMLILPGSFIATLFAMPVFDWTSSNPITRHFWIYFAVTIPLTLATFLSWKLWMKLRLKRADRIKRNRV